MADDEGELKAQDEKRADAKGGDEKAEWSTPPEAKGVEPLKPPAFLPEVGVPMNMPPASPLPPAPPPAAAPVRGPTSFPEMASKMGREIVKVSPVFRMAGVLIVAGALILAAENALIFTGTVSFATGSGLNFGGEGASNNTSANATGNVFAGTHDYFAKLTFATQLDLLGYLLLGLGAICLGVGSRGVEFRMRFDGSSRKPSIVVLVFGLASGICSLLWVYLTITWRTSLTGSATGDWTFVPVMFDPNSYSSGTLPLAVTRFMTAFPAASITWLVAVAIQIPAAALFYGAGWGVKRETGIRVGGVGWIMFSVLALLGMVAFVVAMLGLVGVLQGVSSGGGGGSSLGESLQGALMFIILAAASKLVFVPLWAIPSFLLLSGAGFKLMGVKAGRVVMGDADIEAVTQTPTVLAPAAESPWKVLPGDLPTGRTPTPVGEAAPPKGDIVVNLSGPVGVEREPPKT